MVDPHQVLIDNGNNSTKIISETQNLPANLIPMNDSDKSKQNQNQQNLEVNCSSVVVNDPATTTTTTTTTITKILADVNEIYEHRQNVYDKVDDSAEIMCGPLSRNSIDSTINENNSVSVTTTTTTTTTTTAFLAAQNGTTTNTLTPNNFTRDIEQINAVNNPQKVCIIVKNKQEISESDDSYSEQTLPTTSSINNNSADNDDSNGNDDDDDNGNNCTKIEHNSAEFQLQNTISNTTIATVFNQIDATPLSVPLTSTSKMDSRKVEPLRININRDPIKTKIKLGTSSNNASLDECDDIGEMPHENQQSYPKIIIKPIVKPTIDTEHHHHNHNHSTSSHAPSSSSTSSQEAIPKLKIKKVDTNNSNSILTPLPTHSATLNSDDIQGNYQTHLLSESSSSVPKLATMRGSTTNLSIGSNSYDDGNCTASNEVIPKLTIKLDNHNQHSAAGDSPRSLKLTLKPIAEPPLPRFTITNAFNDTAKVVMLNNSEQTDESSDELPSQPPSSQPSPSDKNSSRGEYATHAITSTSSSYSGPNAEDNLSTCSSGSSSSYSSSSSIANNDIKLIIKATSTKKGCVVSPNSSVVRNSPSSMKSSNNLKVSSSKTNSGDHLKMNNITSNVVTSSTVNSNDSIPKLNIKLSGSDYAQVIHNEHDQNDIGRTESPLPKLTIRMSNTTHDDNIVIPKVKIKPVVNPNDNIDLTTAGTQLVTPKIILKSIPKPIEKPLEIITTGHGSPFRNSENESQQSPRIILKINKNSTSQTIIADDPIMRVDSPQPVKQNELKRSNHESDVLAKKQKLATDVVQLLSSDSEPDDDQTPPSSQPPSTSLTTSSSSSSSSSTTTNNNHNEVNNRRDPLDISIKSTPSISFDTNSGLRSILTRPQMKIQPQPIHNFLQTLPPFKSSSTSDCGNSKVNDVIDLCHDSNDQVIDAPMDEESTSKDPCNDQPNEMIDTTNDTNKLNHGKQRINEQNKKSNYWQYFYNNESEKEQNEPVHPLLQQNIERANVLAAMMEAANKQDRSTNGSNNNNAAKKEEFNQTTTTNNLLIENEGSSSDCIVIEDTASEPFPNEFGSGENSIEQNGRKKDSVDRDSGVDVSNSVKSINEDEATPVVKRPRGRPRKGTTPKTITKKPVKTPGSKRKFASVQIVKPDVPAVEEPSLDNSFTMETLSVPPLEIVDEISLTQTQNIDQRVEDVVPIESVASVPPIQQTDILTSAGTITITSPILPIAMDTSENSINESPTQPVDQSIEQEAIQSIENINVSSQLTVTPTSGHVTMDTAIGLISPTTPSVPKERKKRIIIDDDDESPTFNPLRSTKKSRGKNRRKQLLLKKQQQKAQLFSPSGLALGDKTNESAVFTSPEGIELRKVVQKDTPTTAGLQVFEEDTRMSADSLFASPSIRTTEFLQNDESQSSLHSSTSATVESSAKKIRSKIEVADPEGRTEFTVDMIAEYDWPPPKGCCPSRNRDTFMVQEQIAEYLGVKSFKRKYPDLPRRMVEMEERNYLLEKGLVSEKMCDLGLTAVLASDILDIMNNDFYEKYEEYRRYLREKQIRDLTARQKQMQAGILGKSLSARENAMRAASMWNTDFNRSRTENRNECLDLQNFVIQVPDVHRNRPNRPVSKPSHYPVALVPGQFQEHYKKYSAAELLCYPINTVLAEPYQLDKKLREYYNRVRRSHYNSSDESGDDSDSSCTSDSDSDDSDSSDDSSSSSDESSDEGVAVKKAEKIDDKTNLDIKPPTDSTKIVPKVEKSERNKCQICNGPERCNQQQKPEIFVGCTICKGNAHPTCLKMSARMVRRVNEYAWQCKKCKNCIKCRRNDNEDKMLFCDQCDRSYHIYCIGLRKIPNGKWHCAVCTVCTLCGARRPEGHNNPNLTAQQKQKLLAVAKWTHEYQENPVTGEQEHISMLCTSCMAIKHSAAKNVYFN